MAKPIFIVTLLTPDMTSISTEDLTRVEKTLSQKLDDYHILITYELSETNTTTFQVLNATDADDINIDEIREIIKTKLKWDESQLKM